MFLLHLIGTCGESKTGGWDVYGDMRTQGILGDWFSNLASSNTRKASPTFWYILFSEYNR